VDDITVAGVKVDDLRKGPGHFPDTPLPGQLGNSAIAGHRTTFGAPFNRVDELSPGDEIIVTTVQGRFVYTVTGTSIVAPTALEVLDPTAEATLTLVSCHPKYSARQRIIVKAVLDPTASAEPQPASAPYESTAAEDDPEIDDDPRLTIPGSEEGEGDGSGNPTAGRRPPARRLGHGAHRRRGRLRPGLVQRPLGHRPVGPAGPAHPRGVRGGLVGGEALDTLALAAVRAGLRGVAVRLLRAVLPPAATEPLARATPGAPALSGR
jgi:LPXTG-site transpeptidase (sortase) family protein